MSENILFLGKKIFEISPFFQTGSGDLGKKVHPCSLRFSALKEADMFISEGDLERVLVVGLRAVSLESGMFSRELQECMNVFIVSIPNE